MFLKWLGLRILCAFLSSCYSYFDFLLAMKQAINIEGFALDKFLELHVAECGWVLEKNSNGQSIVLPRNEFNHPELKKNAADGIQLE